MARWYIFCGDRKNSSENGRTSAGTELLIRKDVPLASLGPTSIYTSGGKVMKLTRPPAAMHSMVPIIHGPPVLPTTLT